MGTDTPGASVVPAWLLTGHGSAGSRGTQHWNGASCLLFGDIGVVLLCGTGVLLLFGPGGGVLCAYSSFTSMHLSLSSMQLVSPTASLLAAHPLPVRVHTSVSSAHPNPVGSSVPTPAGLSHEWEPSEVLSVGMPHHWVSRGSGCRELMWAMPLPSGGGGSVFLEQAGSRCPRCHPQDRAQDDRSQKPHHLPRRW